MHLTPRKLRVLASIVSYYVASGEPVGSKLIADEIGVSSATVRNEMAELTELGLLEQPHTSAGRIPSCSGYRAYLSNAAEPLQISEEERLYFDSVLALGTPDTEKLLSNAALALSSRMTCAVTTPNGVHAVVRAVQFVQISRRTGMLILMNSSGTMKSKLFHCEFDLTAEIMRIFFRAFNERLAGKSIRDITPAFIQTLAVSFGEMALLVSAPLLSLLQAATETVKIDVLLSGQMNLLLHPEFERHRAQQLLQLIQNPEELGALLTGPLFLTRPHKTAVLLGREAGRAEFAEAGVVSAKYTIDGKEAGVFALIGPLRMDYPRVLAHVKYVSAAVSKTLTARMQEEI